MRALWLAALLAGAPPAAAAPLARAGAPFPQAFSGMIRVSLERDPLYASRLLASFERHVGVVAGMGKPEGVRDYLEIHAIGSRTPEAAAHVQALIARGALEPGAAGALLLANALARPEQFPETMDGLETARPGLGSKAAELLGRADGKGDRRLIAALRAAGARRPQAEFSLYGRDGRLEALFDGSADSGLAAPPSAAPVAAEGYTGYGPDGRPRLSGLSRPPAVDVKR